MDINTPQQMYMLLKDWHDVSVQNANMLYTVPTDGSIEVEMEDLENPENNTIITLTEDNIDVFHAGVTAVLSLFGELPFNFNPQEPEDAIS